MARLPKPVPSHDPAKPATVLDPSYGERFTLSPAQARSVLQRTATTIAENGKIRLVYDPAGDPRTDGTTIYIPPPEITSWEGWVKTRGYIDHESAHILWTTFQDMRDLKLPIEQYSLNLLEDVRINAKLRATYAGSKENLAGLYGSICRQCAKAQASGKVRELKPWEARGGALQTELENLTTLGMPADFFGKVGADFAEQYADEFAQACATATSSTDLVPHAKRLAKLLDPEQQAPQENPKPEDGEGEGDGEDGEGEGSSGGPQETDENGNPKPRKQAAGALESFLSGAMKKEIGAQKATGWKVQTIGNRNVIPTLYPWKKRYSAYGGAQPQYEQAMRAAAGLRDNMKSAIQARTRAKKMRDQHDGALDLGKLATIAARVNDPAIYSTVSQGKAVDTAIHALLDLSGSMQCRELEAATAATMLAEAAIACNAAVRLSSFDDAEEGYIWCDYGERPTRAQWVERAQAMRAGNGTPTANHIHVASRDIQRRKEKRKIVLVITDGAPDDQEYCEDMVHLARAAQVEVYYVGIGLGAQTVAQVSRVVGANAFVNVQAISGLRQALVVMLSRLLLTQTGTGRNG